MLPRVVLHFAVSADSRLDHINPDLGVYYGLAARWKEDATLVGLETIMAAPDPVEPETAEDLLFEGPDPEDMRPLIVVPDSKGRYRNWHMLRRYGYWRDAVAFCSESTPADYFDYLRERRVDVIVAGKDRVDLRAALEELHARHGVHTVRVDSGGTLAGVLLRQGLVGEVSLLVQPVLVGGDTPRSFFRAPDLKSDSGVIPLRLLTADAMEGGVVWLHYEVLEG